LDGLEEVKRWAGDEVEGGRADLGSWVVERGDGLRSGNLRGSRRPGGRNEGQPRDFGNWAESGHGPKRRMRKRKKNEFLLIFRILFRGNE
jgi:hypothetical protein